MQNFHSVIVRDCQDIKECMEQVYNFYALSEGSLCFDILSIHTFKRFLQDELVAISDEDFKELYENAYNQEGFDIVQHFDISIRESKQSDMARFVALEIDEYGCILKLIMKAGLDSNVEQFWEHLYEEIERQKAMLHVIIEPSEKILKAGAIKKLQEQCGINGVLEQEISVEILRADTYKPQLASDAIFLPKIAWEKKNNTILDFASYAVDSQEEVLKVSIAQDGVSGRNLLGQYVEIPSREKESEEKNKQTSLNIKYDDKFFSKVEQDKYVMYNALVKGYVSFSDNTLKLLELQEFKEVNMRSTGSLVGGIQKDIMITITCPNPQNDALGQGTVLEASQIDIVGSIGEKARIIGTDVKIHGQTHQSAYIQAKNCEIDFHKGSVIAQNIKIKHSELGSVDGCEVDIDEVSGGSINAKKARINKLHSHAKIYISDTLEIQSLDGSENEIYITPLAYYESRNIVEQNNAYIQQCIDKVNRLLGLFNKDNHTIKKSKPIIAQLKAIVEEKKRLNEPIDSKITKAIAEYIATIKRAQFLKERILALQTLAKDKNNELKNIDEALKNATILCRSPWNNHNEIFYDHLFPKGRDMLTIQDAKQSHIVINKENLKLTMVEALDSKDQKNQKEQTSKEPNK